jgi:hypothetical protein
LVCGVPLLEQTFKLKIEEAYHKLKNLMIEKGCRVQFEEQPRKIHFKQGSLWGISPKTAKKIISADLKEVEGGTRISFSSRLASSWKNITLIGCAFAFVLVVICAWMATDLTTFVATSEPSFWSWIFAGGSNVDLVTAKAFINLTWGLTLFLSVIILLEVLIVVYARSKIDVVVQETLNQLS